jgi:signal transduction histidine kinase
MGVPLRNQALVAREGLQGKHKGNGSSAFAGRNSAVASSTPERSPSKSFPIVGIRPSPGVEALTPLPKALAADAGIAFFREPRVYRTLQRMIFPRIMVSLEPAEPVRIWVPGCSSGEEVYSIAIALHEYLGETAMQKGIRIFGTDTSSSNLGKARAAIYSEAATQGLSPERLRRFFVKVYRGYQVAKPIRAMCVFGHHDLTGNHPFSRMDLISCRNLPVHLSPALQRRVLDSFYFALKPTGFLILGQPESLSMEGTLYSLRDCERHVYSKAKVEVDVGVNEQELRRLSARLMTAAEEERKGIARELHDSVGQRLAGVSLKVSEVESLISSQPEVARKLRKIRKEISEVAKAIHDLSHSLHPAAVSQLGLAAALEAECAAFSKLHGITVNFSAESVPQSLPDEVALCLYRVAQEGLQNIRKHARAKTASVRLAGRSQEIAIVIQDFGRGFDLHAARRGDGLGLVSMEERVRLARGSLSVTSKPGDSTRIEVHIPIRAAKIAS